MSTERPVIVAAKGGKKSRQGSADAVTSPDAKEVDTFLGSFVGDMLKGQQNPDGCLIWEGEPAAAVARAASAA